MEFPFQTEVLLGINTLRQNPSSFIPLIKEYIKHIKGNQLDMPNSEIAIQLEEVETYCRWGGSLFEALDFAPRTSSRDLIVAWLVDDGNLKRSHRKQLFNEKFKFFGVASGQHSKLPIKCSVALFSAQIESLQQGLDGKTVTNIRAEKLLKIDWAKFAKELFELINKVRQSPQKYVSRLEKSLDRFTFGTHILNSSDGDYRVLTNEGPLAYVEAIEFLKVQKPLKAFVWSTPLAQAASDHVIDLKSSGLVGVVGSDGSLPTDRIQRYCGVNEKWAESTVFGFLTAWEALEQLIVSDGQPQVRGHRNTLFGRTDLNYIGIAAAPHPSDESVVSLVFAKDILPVGQNQKINVTVTDKIPEELLAKMKSMGIDTSRIKVVQDDQNGAKAEQRARNVFQQSASHRRSSVTIITPRLQELSRPTTAKRLSEIAHAKSNQTGSTTNTQSTKNSKQILRSSSQGELDHPSQFISFRENKKTNFKEKQVEIRNQQKKNEVLNKKVSQSDNIGPTVKQSRQSEFKLRNFQDQPNTQAQKVQKSKQSTVNFKVTSTKIATNAQKQQDIKVDKEKVESNLIHQHEHRSELPKHNFQKHKSTDQSSQQQQSQESIAEIAQQYRQAQAIQRFQEAKQSLQISPEQPKDMYSDNFQLNRKEKKPRKSRLDRYKAKQEASTRNSCETSPESEQNSLSFNVEEDPDYPATAMNSHIVIEEVEINGKRQRVIRKSYQLVDGTIHNITRVKQL